MSSGAVMAGDAVVVGRDVVSAVEPHAAKMMPAAMSGVHRGARVEVAVYKQGLQCEK